MIFPSTLINRWLPWLTLGIGLILTTVAGVSVYQIAKAKEKSQFEHLVSQTKAAFADNFNTYQAMLRATQGLYASSPRVTSSNFYQFINSFELRKRYPGIEGIGYIQRVFPDSRQGVVRTKVINLEPIEGSNQNILGQDLYQETGTQIAMEESWQLNSPIASGGTNLNQELYLFLPVYLDDVPIQTIQQRKAALQGFVFGLFKINETMKEILIDNPLSGLGMIVYDQQINSERVLFTSEEKPKQIEYYQTGNLEVAGLNWQVEYFNGQGFEYANERRLVPFVLIGGGVLSLLLFMVTLTQIEARLISQRAKRKLEISRAALRQSQERYRLVVDNVGDLINVLDIEGNYIFVSPSYKEVLGYEPQELIGKNIRSMVHPDDLVLTKKQIMLASKNKPKRVIYRLKHKDGHYLTIEGIRTTIRDDQERPFLMVSVARDVTARVELEKRKDDFISIASHELRTPLTSLKLYTQLLANKYQQLPKSEETLYLDKMKNQINKMVRMVGDLLDLAKMESGKMELKIEPVNLEKLIREMVEEMRKIHQHRIILHGKLTGEVYGDRQRLSEVFGNIITNAIKYSPEAKKVDVYLEKKAKYLVVRVQDYGLGIEKEDLKRVFEKYYQTTKTSKISVTGLGLGLYICAQIVKKHKGRIWVKSKVGKGSIFGVELPVI